MVIVDLSADRVHGTIYRLYRVLASCESGVERLHHQNETLAGFLDIFRELAVGPSLDPILDAQPIESSETRAKLDLGLCVCLVRVVVVVVVVMFLHPDDTGVVQVPRICLHSVISWVYHSLLDDPAVGDVIQKWLGPRRNVALFADKFGNMKVAVHIHRAFERVHQDHVFQVWVRIPIEPRVRDGWEVIVVMALTLVPNHHDKE